MYFQIIQLFTFIFLFNFCHAQQPFCFTINDFQLFEYPNNMQFNEAVNKDSIKYTTYHGTNTTYVFNIKDRVMIEVSENATPIIREILLLDTIETKFTCNVRINPINHIDTNDTAILFATFLLTDFIDNSMQNVLIVCTPTKDRVYGWFTPKVKITRTLSPAVIKVIRKAYPFESNFLFTVYK